MTSGPNSVRRVPYFAIVSIASAATLLSVACNLQLPTDGSRTLGASGADSQATPFAPSESAAPGTALADGGADAAARAIEEADILKIDGGVAYALHQYKGLFLIDVSDPDKPAITGRLEFSGAPVELYVVGQRAYVVLNSNVYYPYYATGAATFAAEDVRSSVVAPGLPPAPDFQGSKVAVVDVSDKANPKSMGSIQLVGYANASRRVGDVIYVVGTDLPQVQPVVPVATDVAPSFYASRAFVASINVANPNDIKPVDRKTFSGDGLNLHVSSTALFAATVDYSSFAKGGPNDSPPEAATRVQVADISDPAGHIVLRGTFSAPGTIRNRFYMDDYNNTFRIATESFGFGFQTVRVFTFDLTDPDHIAALGSVEVIRNEGLEAARFDGPRGYLVTFLRRDPLFVIDLSNPARPTVTGQLDVPGFSTHIEPRGDRLVAVGIDDQQGQRPAIVLYDVHDPAKPAQLSRIVLGPPNSFTESQAIYDEKAFKIVDELDLIAMPFRYTRYDVVPAGNAGGGTVPPATPASGATAPDVAIASLPPVYNSQCVSAVQLIDFTADALKQRGWFEHRGNPSRVGVVGTRAYALSDIGFQTVNIDDRDHPVSLAFASFLDPTEMSYFDGCGYYYYPNVPIEPYNPFPVINLLIDPQALLAALNEFASQSGACGTVSVMPLAGIVAGIAGLSWNTRRRRK